MAIELQREALQTGQVLSGKPVQTVVDTDIIVPDSKPDVLQVLQVDVASAVGETYLQPNRLTVSGTVRYQILYAADRGEAPGQVKGIVYTAPFSHQVEIQGLDNTAMTAVTPDVVHVEFAIRNSRKINVKTVIELTCDAVQPHTQQAVCGVGEAYALPCRKEELQCYHLAACQTDAFFLGDALQLPAGNPMPEEILKVDICIDGKEIRVVNNKILAKGNVNICTLYTATDGSLSSMEHQLPFSQVIDVPQLTGQERCKVAFLLGAPDYKITQDNDGDPTLLDFQVEVSAVTKAYAQSAARVLTDVYSPDYQVDIQRQEVAVSQLCYSGTDQLVIKEQIAIEAEQPPIARIYHVIAKPYLESAGWEKGKITINGTIDAYLLYLTATPESPVYSVKREIPFTHVMDAPGAGDSEISVSLAAEHINYSLQSAAEAEVRVVISADTQAVKTRQIQVITDISLDESAPIDKSGQPGIVIYFAKAGDALWDIARQYHTTAEEIAAVNQLDCGDTLPQAQQLLIPKYRTI